MAGQNRIVVNYGDREELVLLACIDTKTGEETDISEIDWSHKATKYDFNSFDEIVSSKENFDDGNTEGFVIRFESGLRIKVKLDEYVRLHRLLTGLTKRAIWELMRDGDDIEKLYETAPDEVYEWVEETMSFIDRSYYGIELMSEMVFERIKEEVSDEDGEFTRKEFALFTQDTPLTKINLFVDEPYTFSVDVTPIMFRMLDDREYSSLIWKLIKPEHEELNTQG